MSKQDDGGTAFPFNWICVDSSGDRVVRESYPGMSLRDWFAGMTMQGLCVCDGSSTEPEDWDYDTLAECAYKAADAMLRARTPSADGGAR